MIGGSTFGKHHTEDSIKKLRDKLKGEKNPMYGKRHSEETKRKMSENRKGKHSGEQHWLYGKRQSDETKRKQSIVKIGKYDGSKNPNARKIICLETSEIFYCIREAAKKHNVHWKSIWKACKGISKTSAGYHWGYVNE